MLTIEQIHEQKGFRLLCIISAQKSLKDIVDIRRDGGVEEGACFMLSDQNEPLKKVTVGSNPQSQEENNHEKI